MNRHVLCACLHMLQCIISLALSILLAECGICSSFSVQTHSAELIVHAAFFSACFFSTLSPHAARCGSFFGSTAAVGDEYSRAVLGDDTAEKDWRLFDIWDWRFDKLPVISAKLSLRVTGADGSGKARCFSDC
ncbi:hypothetical protein ACFX1Q_003907 [Malus domestica]